MSYFKVFGLCLLVILSACSSKPTLSPEASTSALEQAGLKGNVSTNFAKAVDLIKQTDVSKEDLIKAKDILLAINDSHPEYLGPIINLGIIEVKAKRLKEAKLYFQQIIDFDSEGEGSLKSQQMTIASLNYLGVIAREEGMFDEAESYYKKVLALDKDNQSALRNLAILLDLYRGRLDEALVLYEQYQNLQTEPVPKVKDWIFDIKSRIKSGN